MPLPFLVTGDVHKFIPVKAKLGDLYKNTTKNKVMSPTVKKQAVKALRDAGYTEIEVKRILTKNEDLPIKKLKKIALALNAGHVFGFKDEHPEIAVKRYLTKEQLKKKTINRILKQHIAERRAEDLDKPIEPHVAGTDIGGNPSVLINK